MGPWRALNGPKPQQITFVFCFFKESIIMDLKTSNHVLICSIGTVITLGQSDIYCSCPKQTKLELGGKLTRSEQPQLLKFSKTTLSSLYTCMVANMHFHLCQSYSRFTNNHMYFTIQTEICKWNMDILICLLHNNNDILEVPYFGHKNIGHFTVHWKIHLPASVFIERLHQYLYHFIHH